METEFWHQRWEKNEIGFHRDSINPHLKSHWQQLSLPPQARVLVPCCGKTLDLIWLAEQGFHVIGVELSSLAVEAFFSENGLNPAIKDHGKIQCYSVPGLEIYCGDLFDLQGKDIGAIDAVYDRAAMIAMPSDMRADYCRHLRQLTGEQAPILLVTMTYPQSEMQGPPFSVSAGEVESAYEDNYQITLCDCQDILSQESHFQARGLSRLLESVFMLMPK